MLASASLIHVPFFPSGCSISDACGGGLVFWHPKGAMVSSLFSAHSAALPTCYPPHALPFPAELQVRHLIEGFWKDTHLQHGYQLLYTPHIAKVDLWKTSGHFDFYRDSMFNQMDVDAEEYQACPG